MPQYSDCTRQVRRWPPWPEALFTVSAEALSVNGLLTDVWGISLGRSWSSHFNVFINSLLTCDLGSPSLVVLLESGSFGLVFFSFSPAVPQVRNSTVCIFLCFSFLTRFSSFYFIGSNVERQGVIK